MATFAFKIRPQILLFKAAEPHVKISQISKRAKRFAANRGCEAAEGASCRQTRSRAIDSVSKSTRGWHQQTTNNCPQLHSVGASDDAAMCSHTHTHAADQLDLIDHCVCVCVCVWVLFWAVFVCVPKGEREKYKEMRKRKWENSISHLRGKNNSIFPFFSSSSSSSSPWSSNGRTLLSENSVHWRRISRQGWAKWLLLSLSLSFCLTGSLLPINR